MRPREGFSPTTPQQEAGMRTEPPPSLPWLQAQSPAARAAAAPPLEPPGVRSRSQGLRAVPWRPNSVTGREPNSGVVVRPRIGVPAAFIRATTKASTVATCSRYALDPKVKG